MDDVKGKNGVVRPWRQVEGGLMFPTLFVVLALAVLYWFPVRRWMARWGTTPSDLTRVMAGDSLIVDPTYSGTMAVLVNARPEHIWPLAGPDGLSARRAL